jgi:predicted thioesterase
MGKQVLLRHEKSSWTCKAVTRSHQNHNFNKREISIKIINVHRLIYTVILKLL